jgi:hypothetical protein
MTATQNLDNMTCKFIPLDDLHDGHLTAMGTVVGEPQFSPSRKTATVTIRKHSGNLFSDRRSASAKVAVWVPKA